MTDAAPQRQITLTFEDIEAFEHVDDPIHQDLSAAARWGDALFLSCDETAGIDRLTRSGNNKSWGAHAHFNLGELIDLPGGPGGEMDIEGLDADDGWLWIVGSHSLKRGKAEGDPAGALANMARIGSDPNRAFLARVPLVDGDGGPRPAAKDGKRRLAHIRLKKKRSVLRGWLKGDPHLGAFLELPRKENGFDIEGIAVRGLRVWLGLRGPVLRGHAVVLEMHMKVTRSGELKPKRIDGGRRYRKHVMDLHGQGVRDLAIDGGDLIVLGGPAMSGDGASAIWRWRDALDAGASGVVPRTAIEMMQELPYHGHHDHPEGLVPWDDDAWLVVYDSPAPERLKEKPARTTADVWKP